MTTLFVILQFFVRRRIALEEAEGHQLEDELKNIHTIYYLTRCIVNRTLVHINKIVDERGV